MFKNIERGLTFFRKNRLAKSKAAWKRWVSGGCLGVRRQNGFCVRRRRLYAVGTAEKARVRIVAAVGVGMNWLIPTFFAA